MDSVNRLITDRTSSYLKELPVPKSFGGFAELKLGEWVRLAAFTGAVGFAGFVAVRGVFTLLPEDFLSKLPCRLTRGKYRWMNKCIEKERPKCNHVIDIEDIGKKASLCRCWRSAKFPYCDGAHKQYNRETGDNVGPINVVRKTTV
ncbi:CDGSH iron-sulfur domain-containing protein 2 homolog B-like [Paramacrobiotus metropolitanus]|uniref:CDGSH iron-sulfur domain-containing protein 2 homolog B-like n=1 Tax=Paramacrobiotus metropolitanus TaxID=2943436 RepID=UPI0024465D1C|nr:CDGSH iron-sulfur domain-containing protein 2 homolog B-like [Paramacrobiotus metropolitanus]XP_055343228.1 CDGSH iron-sulfur domain-containing protein 2 homolog B-like [Paramacrobiotus metropolitanus]